MPLSQNPESGRKLQRQYGFRSIPELNVAEEIVPVVLLDNLEAVFPSELARPAIGTASLTGAAGPPVEQAVIGIIARGLDVLVTGVHFNTPGGSQTVAFRVGDPGAGLTNVDDKTFKNRGIAGLPNANLFTLSTAAPVGTVIYRDTTQTAQGVAFTQFDQPFRLRGIPSAGQTGERALFLSTTTGNTELQVTFEWIETRPFA